MQFSSGFLFGALILRVSLLRGDRRSFKTHQMLSQLVDQVQALTEYRLRSFLRKW